MSTKSQKRVHYKQIMYIKPRFHGHYILQCELPKNNMLVN